MYKCGVIGDAQSVMGFKALGLHTEVCSGDMQAAKALHSMAREDYAVIFITEQLASLIREDIDRYKDVPEIAVIPIPGVGGSMGIGISEIHSAVERAVGADILKEK